MRIIRGKYGRRRFTVPTNITARPTTDFARENIFNIIENLIDFNDEPVALDLFAGTGAITFELLSRGCKSVTSVEKAAVQHSFIRKVASELGAENLNLIKGDALKYASTSNRKYDLIFADPPYNLPDFEQVADIVINSNMIKPETIFILEHSKAYDFSNRDHFVDHREYGSVNFSIFDFSK